MIEQVVIGNELEQFCLRWRVAELSLFGSALRDDFDADSDVDVLVTFSPDADWDLLDHIQMEMELSELFGREVDLLTRRGVERSANPMRRREILETARVVYST